ncbi:hypothetical protein [uncultured Empedobacter sp.]|uniref:hypothetical protein n=1 Tax=uncultured Empedobacter sp. TaxID=410844 RepID=UPI0025F27B76|nr:hypothetical protein [uncultured Empedobacter sp.]
MEENSHIDGRGGARNGAGRKPKADEEKTNQIFLTMIKDVKKVDTDDEARIALAKELFSFERGCMFIAEHVFGKPKEIIEQTNIDAKSIPIVLSDGKTYEDLKNELQPE